MNYQYLIENLYDFTIEPTRMLDNSIIEMNCGLSYFKHCQTKGFVV